MGALDGARFPVLDQNSRRRKQNTLFDTQIKWFFFTDVIKKLHFLRLIYLCFFVFFLISFSFFLFHSDKRLYSTSGGEVLFTKLDQEAEMDIKVTTTTTTTTTKIWESCFLLRLLGR